MREGGYRSLFKRAVAALGLSATYVPHSLRHGGATTLYMSGVSVENIKVRGRWKRLDTCERYIQSGEAAMGVVLAPAAVVKLGIAVSQSLVQSLYAAEIGTARRAPASDGMDHKH